MLKQSTKHFRSKTRALRGAICSESFRESIYYHGKLLGNAIFDKSLNSLSYLQYLHTLSPLAPLSSPILGMASRTCPLAP